MTRPPSLGFLTFSNIRIIPNIKQRLDKVLLRNISIRSYPWTIHCSRYCSITDHPFVNSELSEGSASKSSKAWKYVGKHLLETVSEWNTQKECDGKVPDIGL